MQDPVTRVDAFGAVQVRLGSVTSFSGSLFGEDLFMHVFWEK
jgi:hypothetical protein